MDEEGESAGVVHRDEGEGNPAMGEDGEKPVAEEGDRDGEICSGTEGDRCEGGNPTTDAGDETELGEDSTSLEKVTDSLGAYWKSTSCTGAAMSWPHRKLSRSDVNTSSVKEGSPIEAGGGGG